MDFEHDRIWAAIDNVAMINNLSTSGLAKRAGLDPTAFNKSKRFYPSGKKRWPSTESLCKVIFAADMDWGGFAGIICKGCAMPSITDMGKAA